MPPPLSGIPSFLNEQDFGVFPRFGPTRSVQIGCLTHLSIARDHRRSMILPNSARIEGFFSRYALPQVAKRPLRKMRGWLRFAPLVMFALLPGPTIWMNDHSEVRLESVIAVNVPTIPCAVAGDCGRRRG